MKKAVLPICSYFSFLCSEEHNVILMYSCYLVGCPHSQGKINSQVSFCQIQKTVFLCRTLHVCIHKVGTRVLLSLNIAVFLALLLLLEDQSQLPPLQAPREMTPLTQQWPWLFFCGPRVSLQSWPHPSNSFFFGQQSPWRGI